MDTVQGKMRKKEATLIVLTERVSNKEIIIKMESKSKEGVKKVLDMLEIELGIEKFRAKFKTITSDNGKEFWDYEEIEKSTYSEKTPRTKLFYADAYCSWQRGANENANKMIRRWLPKYTSLNDVTPEDITKIEHWMRTTTLAKNTVSNPLTKFTSILFPNFVAFYYDMRFSPLQKLNKKGIAFYAVPCYDIIKLKNSGR
jgi:hypothetical protein